MPLDHDKRDALVGHLNRMGVAELMWCEPASHACFGGGAAELSARGCWFPVAAGGRAVDHAEERADREPGANLLPGLELFPGLPTSRRLPPLPRYAGAGVIPNRGCC
jgi:hypothetical protein